MNHRLYILLINVVIALSLRAQWTPVPSGTLINLRDVHFPSDSVGYIVGGYGIVLKSTDRGDTWQTVHLDSSYSAFYSVFFTSNDTGYAAGGNLYKTTDGGYTWLQVLTDTFSSIAEVYFVNANLGFAGAQGSLYKTSDGGATWTVPITGGIVSSVHFPGSATGYFVGGPDYGDPLYKTLDSGQTFIQISNGFQSIKEATYFLNDSTGYLCGWYGGLIAKTTDGGSTWLVMDTISWPQCFDIHFTDESTGYYIENGGGAYAIRNTVDGGLSWTTQLLQASNAWLRNFFFIDPQTAIAVGDSGKIYKTVNGGGLGMPETENLKNFVLYPNPSDGLVAITGDEKINSIEVYNRIGELVFSAAPCSAHYELDMRYMPKGLYLARVITATSISGGKLIIE